VICVIYVCIWRKCVNDKGGVKNKGGGYVKSPPNEFSGAFGTWPASSHAWRKDFDPDEFRRKKKSVTPRVSDGLSRCKIQRGGNLVIRQPNAQEYGQKKRKQAARKSGVTDVFNLNLGRGMKLFDILKWKSDPFEMP
jgi:hypothetical protein